MLLETIAYRESLSPEEFTNEFLATNRPVLIGPGLTTNWKARQAWVQTHCLTYDFDPGVLWDRIKPLYPQYGPEYQFFQAVLEEIVRGTKLTETPREKTPRREFRFAGPRWSYWKERFGNAQVSVSDCWPELEKDSTEGENGHHYPQEQACGQAMTMLEFLALYPNTHPGETPDVKSGDAGTLWVVLIARLEHCAKLPGEALDQTVLQELFGEFWHHDHNLRFKCKGGPLWSPTVAKRRYYLKDWHMTQQFPDEGAYDIPGQFADDWINQFWDHWDAVQDDYRFVYMGGHGTWTPFHTDVFKSYSWSSNICGIKHWVLYPPTEEDSYTDSLKNTVFDVYHYPTARFPNFSQAKVYHVYQMPGQTLYVPSGWAHQVENIGDTVSINHNWGNAFNVSTLYNELELQLDNVEHAIQDVQDMDDWSGHCQLLLKVNHGINLSDFFHYLDFKTRDIVTRLLAMPRFDSSRKQLLEYIPETCCQHAKCTHSPNPTDYSSTPDYLYRSLQPVQYVLRAMVQNPRYAQTTWHSKAQMWVVLLERITKLQL
ncbi:hypothetical protein IWQ62_000761 [Dispira parvispora]|uniref:JmjC domain-containing protein n=1 Tax=Dispira parvispora TaxID=1520584 RepID=A0A9W8E4M8_9FUNG|nr:hypothetical protein IWQ62_000761 [Dispira parvispora]